MIKAVIFDMDGVLVDTEPIWSKGDQELLKRKGINYNDALIDKKYSKKEDLKRADLIVESLKGITLDKIKRYNKKRVFKRKMAL